MSDRTNRSLVRDRGWLSFVLRITRPGWWSVVEIAPRVSPRPQRHLAKTSDEGALDSCFEEEVEAKAVEGRRSAVIICATDH